MEVLRSGWLMAVANVPWSGRVLDPRETDPDTIAIRAFNEKLLSDDRIHLSMIPIADGLTLPLKLPLADL